MRAGVKWIEPCSYLDFYKVATVLHDTVEMCFLMLEDGSMFAVDKGVPKGALVPMGEELKR